MWILMRNSQSDMRRPISNNRGDLARWQCETPVSELPTLKNNSQFQRIGEYSCMYSFIMYICMYVHIHTILSRHEAHIDIIQIIII